MVGLIHMIFFKTLDRHFGPEAGERVRERAGIPTDSRFRMSHTYSDEEWGRLLRAGIEVTGLSRQELLEHFSKIFIEDAVQRWPAWFELAKSTRDFIKLQPLIHNSIASGLADMQERRKVEDKFRLEEDGDQLVLNYRSPNRLCDLYALLAQELAKHYGETLHIESLACLLKDEMERSLASGFDAHLTKPLDSRRLLACLESLNYGSA